MSLIANLTFKQKLFSLVAPPILGALLFAIVNLSSAYEDKAVVDEIRPLVELSIDSSLIVHELQKERGATSGFIGSKGQSFRDTLASQRRDTDSVIRDKVDELSTSSDSFRDIHPKIYRDIQDVLQRVKQLERIRTQADNLAISAPEAAKFYTDLNASLLGVSGDIANLSTYGDLTTKLRNYYTFMQAKESAGQERAILNIAISHGSFQEGIYQKAVTLNSFQQAYLNTFRQFASNEQLRELEALRSSQPSRRVAEIKEITNKKYIEGNFGVSGEEWFSVATSRINQMKELED